jgi:hypothetical protein
MYNFWHKKEFFVVAIKDKDEEKNDVMPLSRK